MNNLTKIFVLSLVVFMSGCLGGKDEGGAGSSSSGSLGVSAVFPAQMNSGTAFGTKESSCENASVQAFDSKGIEVYRTVAGFTSWDVFLDKPGVYSIVMTCEDGRSFRTLVDVFVLSEDANQPPLIRVAAQRSGEVFMVSSDPRENRKSPIIVEGKSYTLDFSGSEDEDESANPVRPLVHQVSVNGGAFQSVGNSMSISSTSLGLSAGDIANVRVKVTDYHENTTLLSFDLFVACDPDGGSYAALSLPSNGVSVVENAVPNDPNFRFFNANVQGGSGNFRCTFDYNCDGQTDVGEGDCSNNLQYVAFEGQRGSEYNVPNNAQACLLKVRDTTCNWTKTFEFSRNLSGPYHQANIPAYHYLQADFSGEDSGENDVSVTPFIVRQPVSKRMSGQGLPKPHPEDRVDCSYSPGKDEADGIFDLNVKHTHFNHLGPMQSKIQIRIPDPNDFDDGSYSIGGAATVEALDYWTDGRGDGFSRNHFNLSSSSSCEATMNVVVAVAEKPCSDGSSVKSVTTTMDGTFACSNLTDGSSGKIDANNGSFFCEWSTADGCVGGGGGGGNPPPGI